MSNSKTPTRRACWSHIWCKIDGLCDRVRAEIEPERSEVMVIAPALAGRLHTLTDDIDQERTHARERLEDVIARLERHGLSARGEIADKDPVLAIRDALAALPADKIVLVTEAEDHQNWKETDISEKCEQFGLSVQHLTVIHDLAE